MTAENYSELALIGIMGENDAAEIQFAGHTEDISAIEFGEKDFEGKPLLNGGRVKKRTPMTDESVTMKVVPIGVARDGSGIAPFLAGTTDPNKEDPYSVLNTNLHEKFRVVILVADELPATASSAVTAGRTAYRMTVCNAECTKASPSYDDKDFTGEITFKWTPFKKDAKSNKLEESTTSNGFSAVSVGPLDGFTAGYETP